MNELQAIKVRQLIQTELQPTLERIEQTYSKMRTDATYLNQKLENMNKFQTFQVFSENTHKQLRGSLTIQINNLSQVKNDYQIWKYRINGVCEGVKDDVTSINKNMKSMEDFYSVYDKKINGVGDTVKKYQNFTDQRIEQFEQKFKQLTKETLLVTKDAKILLQHKIKEQEQMRKQLEVKLKLTSQKEKIIDLYMSEREQWNEMLKKNEEKVNSLVDRNQYEQRDQYLREFVSDSLEKMKVEFQNKKSSGVNEDFKQFTRDIQKKLQKYDMFEKQINDLKIERQKTIQQQDQKTIEMKELKQETIIIQEKMETIDKKIETISVQLEDNDNRYEGIFEQKIAKIRQEMKNKFEDNEKFKQEINRKISKIKKEKTGDTPSRKNSQQVVDTSGIEITGKINKMLKQMIEEKQNIEKMSKQVKKTCESLSDALFKFNSRISKIRTDLDIHISDTTKQNRKLDKNIKINDRKFIEIGKFITQFIEISLILSSLLLKHENPQQTETFVTYNDGIILQPSSNHSLITYRRASISSKQLNIALILGLTGFVDDCIMNYSSLVQLEKPSNFFNDYVVSSMKNRNQKVNLQSAKNLFENYQQNNNQGESFSFDKLRSDSENLIKLVKFSGQNQTVYSPVYDQSTSGFRISPSTNTKFLNNKSVKPQSEMQRRYKLKKNDTSMKADEQKTQRNCFTASKSHRRHKNLNV